MNLFLTLCKNRIYTMFKLLIVLLSLFVTFASSQQVFYLEQLEPHWEATCGDETVCYQMGFSSPYVWINSSLPLVKITLGFLEYNWGDYFVIDPVRYEIIYVNGGYSGALTCSLINITQSLNFVCPHVPAKTEFIYPKLFPF